MQNGELSSLEEHFHEEDPLGYTEAIEDVELPGDLYADRKNGEAAMLCDVPFHAGYISSVHGFVNHMVAVMPMMCVTIGSGWSGLMKALPVSGNQWVRWQQQIVLCMG